MPWLTVHIALPMAFLTGWFIEQVVSRPLPGPARRGWRLAATAGLAIAVVALIVRVLSLIGGLNLPPGDTARLLVWAASFGIGLIGVVALSYALHRVSHGWAGRATLLAAFGLLAVLTIRTATMVTYINYDYAKEFLFYAHGAPGTKLALDQLTDLSKRVNDGNGIKVGYDSDTSWPMSWYMRLFPGARFIGSDLPADYLDLEAIMISDQNPKRAEVAPKLEENYTQFQHTLVWWPMQDYWDLTWDRISYSLFNPEARAALWDIIFNRDYTRYAKLFNKNSLTPETWSPSHRFSLYIRNDIASKVWDYRVGAVAGGAAETAPLVAPSSVRIQSPVGIAVAEGGERFAIDHKANRVFRLSESGAVLGNWGGFGGGEGKFNDPWGIAIDDDNAVYVADTFNHRVQKFDREGNFLFAWGQPGVSNAPGSGRSTIFFGPRAIVLDSQGRLFVSDTGNKRVQIFDREGNYIDQLGKEGSGPGEFNEPVGLAIDGGGNVYVADTWNKRIQVFGPDFSFIRSWPVTAWEEMDPTELQSVDHKPFLAIRGSTLYVSSPRTHQVLAYTFTGQPVDDPDVSLPDTSLPTGLAVQGDTLLVTDAASGQVFNFTPPSDMQ